MRGQWDNFVQAYENNPMSREAKLTRSGDTALHIAAAAGKQTLYRNWWKSWEKMHQTF